MNMVDTQGLTGFLDGSIPDPPETKIIRMNDGFVNVVTNPLYQSYKRSDTLLKGWITRTLSEEVIGYLLRLMTSAEVWKALHESVV